MENINSIERNKMTRKFEKDETVFIVSLKKFGRVKYSFINGGDSKLYYIVEIVNGCNCEIALCTEDNLTKRQTGRTEKMLREVVKKIQNAKEETLIFVGFLTTHKCKNNIKRFLESTSLHLEVYYESIATFSNLIVYRNRNEDYSVKVEFINPSNILQDVSLPNNTFTFFDHSVLEKDGFWMADVESFVDSHKSRKKDELDEFHYHEIFDRCHVINSMIDDHLLSHIGIDGNKKYQKKLEKAQGLISEVMQDVGDKY